MDIPVAGYVTANVPARIPVQNSNFTLNGTFLIKYAFPPISELRTINQLD